jgi:hypothetical protein
MRPIGRLGLQSRIQNPLFQLLIQDTSRALSLRVPLNALDSAFEKGGPSRIYGGPGQTQLLCRKSESATDKTIMATVLFCSDDQILFEGLRRILESVPGFDFVDCCPGLENLRKQPKPTPELNKPANRIQRIGGSLIRLLQSPWITPPFFIVFNIYLLLRVLGESGPVTRDVVVQIATSVAGTFMGIVNFTIFNILQTDSSQNECISMLSECDLALSDSIKHLAESIEPLSDTIQKLAAPKPAVSLQTSQTGTRLLRKLPGAIKRLFID